MNKINRIFIYKILCFIIIISSFFVIESKSTFVIKSSAEVQPRNLIFTSNDEFLERVKMVYNEGIISFTCDGLDLDFAKDNIILDYTIGSGVYLGLIEQFSLSLYQNRGDYINAINGQPGPNMLTYVTVTNFGEAPSEFLHMIPKSYMPKTVPFSIIYDSSYLGKTLIDAGLVPWKGFNPSFPIIAAISLSLGNGTAGASISLEIPKDSLPSRGEYKVYSNLENLKLSNNVERSDASNQFISNVIPSDGYRLPDTIESTSGDVVFDKSTGLLTISNINKDITISAKAIKVLKIPSQISDSGYIYNGNNYDIPSVYLSNDWTVTSTPQTNVGTYSVKIKPNVGCEWEDGTTAEIERTWNISPKKLIVTVDKINDINASLYKNYVGLNLPIDSVSFARDGLILGDVIDITFSYEYLNDKLVITPNGESSNYDIECIPFESINNVYNYVKIGNIPFDKLNDAVKQAIDNTTILVVGTVEETLIIDKNITIDGGTINGSLTVNEDVVLTLGQSTVINASIEVLPNSIINVKNYLSQLNLNLENINQLGSEIIIGMSDLDRINVEKYPVGIGYYDRFLYVSNNNLYLGGYDDLNVSQNVLNQISVNATNTTGIDEVTVTIGDTSKDSFGTIKLPIDLDLSNKLSVNVSVLNEGVTLSEKTFDQVFSVILFDEIKGIFKTTNDLLYLNKNNEYQLLNSGTIPNDIKIDSNGMMIVKSVDSLEETEIGVGFRKLGPSSYQDTKIIDIKNDNGEIFITIEALDNFEYNLIGNSGLVGDFKIKDNQNQITFGPLKRSDLIFSVIVRETYNRDIDNLPGEYVKILDITSIPSDNDLTILSEFRNWYKITSKGYLHNNGVGLTVEELQIAKYWLTEVPELKIPESVRSYVSNEIDETKIAIDLQDFTFNHQDILDKVEINVNDNEMIINALTNLENLNNQSKNTEYYQSLYNKLIDKLKLVAVDNLDNLVSEEDLKDEAIKNIIITKKTEINSLSKQETETKEEFQIKINQIINNTQDLIELEKYKNIIQTDLSELITSDPSTFNIVEGALELIENKKLENDNLLDIKNIIDEIYNQAIATLGDHYLLIQDALENVKALVTNDDLEDNYISEVIEQLNDEVQNLVQEKNETTADYKKRLDNLISVGSNKIEGKKFINEFDILNTDINLLGYPDQEKVDSLVDEFNKLSVSKQEVLDLFYAPLYDNFTDVINDLNFAIEFNENKRQISKDVEETKKLHDGEQITDLIDEIKEEITNITYPKGTKNEMKKEELLGTLLVKKEDSINRVRLAQLKQQFTNQLQFELENLKNSGNYSANGIQALDNILIDLKEKINEMTDFDSFNISDLIKRFNTVNVIRINSDKSNYDEDNSHYINENKKGLYGVIQNLNEFSSLLELNIERTAASKKLIKVTNSLVKTKNIELKQVINFYLLQNGNQIENFDGTYTVKIFLPKVINKIKNLQFAYLNENNEIEKIETKLENGCLEFETTHLSQVLVLGAKDINLYPLIIVLGLIILSEIIAIYYIKKKHNYKYHTCFVTLVALEFIPKLAIEISVVLGVIAIILLSYLIACIKKYKKNK